MIEPDYFSKLRAQLGMDRADTLTTVQAVLDEWYPGKARAKMLHQGTLRIVTPSAGVASELRMRQVELLARCGLDGTTRVAVAIASLNRG